MLNKKTMEKLRDYMENYDSNREIVIKSSRDVLKLSKLLINSVHRGDLKTAEEYVEKIKDSFEKLNSIVKNDLRYSGSFKVAAQEYVEAIGYYHYVVDKKIPTNEELNVNPEPYITGLSDLTGEVIRKAVNDITEGKNDAAFEAKKFVQEVYDELLKFDFRSSSLRKSFDRLRYNLTKIEEISLKVVIKSAD